MDLCGNHYDCVLSAPLVEQVPLHKVSNISQDLSASLNSDYAAELFAKENQTSEMICDEYVVSVGEEKIKTFGKTIESAENFDPEFTAGSSSDDPVAPPAKKVKVDLPHTRVHNGKTYLLSDYGLKNFEKLLENKQLEIGVKSKKCKECQEEMN